jgi:hypothetical protein
MLVIETVINVFPLMTLDERTITMTFEFREQEREATTDGVDMLQRELTLGTAVDPVKSIYIIELA